MSGTGRIGFIEVHSVPSAVHPDGLPEKTYRVEADGQPAGLVVGRYFSHWGSRGETFPRFWIPTDFDGVTINTIWGYGETRMAAALDLIRNKLGEDIWAGLRDT